MARIVPHGTQPTDSDVVRQLAAAGYIVDFRPDYSDRTSTGAPFIELVRQEGEALRSSFQSVPSQIRRRESFILEPKMDRDLVEALVSEGLANRQHGNLLMHPQLAAVYMTALAEVMAHRRGAHPLTKDPALQLAMADLTTARLAAVLLEDERFASVPYSEGEIESTMATIALRCVAPADISGVPVETIIDIRERHAGYRIQFQVRVNELVETLRELQGLADVDAVHLHLQAEFERTIAPEMKTLERHLKSARIDTVFSAFNAQIAVPPAVGVALGIGGVADPVILSGAGVALAMYGIRRRTKWLREDALKTARVSYLYHVRRELSPSRSVKGLVQRLKELPLRVVH